MAAQPSVCLSYSAFDALVLVGVHTTSLCSAWLPALGGEPSGFALAPWLERRIVMEKRVVDRREGIEKEMEVWNKSGR